MTYYLFAVINTATENYDLEHQKMNKIPLYSIFKRIYVTIIE